MPIENARPFAVTTGASTGMVITLRESSHRTGLMS
jgi:hypothetical protein